MNLDHVSSSFGCGLIFGVVAILFVLNFWPEITRPYKLGQIDAASGKMRYELRKNPDGTTTWEVKK